MIDIVNEPEQAMKTFKEAMQKVRTSPPWMTNRQKEAAFWNPYSFEGGLVYFHFISHREFNLFCENVLQMFDMYSIGKKIVPEVIFRNVGLAEEVVMAYEALL